MEPERKTNEIADKIQLFEQFLKGISYIYSCIMHFSDT